MAVSTPLATTEDGTATNVERSGSGIPGAKVTGTEAAKVTLSLMVRAVTYTTWGAKVERIMPTARPVASVGLVGWVIVTVVPGATISTP